MKSLPRLKGASTSLSLTPTSLSLTPTSLSLTPTSLPMTDYVFNRKSCQSEHP
jgi:hypothetical protein